MGEIMPEIVGYLIDGFGDIVETKEERETRLKLRRGDNFDFSWDWGWTESHSKVSDFILSALDASQTNLNKDKE
jgi:hypothetical protein